MDVVVSFLPIAVLIFLITKPRGWPSHVALPLAALLAYAIKLLYFASDPNSLHARALSGVLEASTPLMIIAGAMLLFRTLDASGSMDVIRRWLTGISANSVAQLMIVGWAFAFLVEGASGFGTPAALAAPILVGLGFDPIRVVVLTLIMNTVPVSFGAVGTPTWFGFGELTLSDDEILKISVYTATIHVAAALVIPLVALLFVVDWTTVRRNLVFVYLSIAACVAPYWVLATFSYEFPSLAGGAIGLIVTVFFAKLGIGLSGKPNAGSDEAPRVSFRQIALATMPLWGSVLTLAVTRIPQLGLRSLLTDREPVLDLALGSLGRLGVSSSLVVSLREIFGEDVRWNLELLYVPAVIPFLLVSAIAFALFRLDRAKIGQIFGSVYRRMIYPAAALAGALVMVKLLMADGERSMAMNIGGFLADVSGRTWPWFAAYLGATGSFFSGSATISNLTFAGIQESMARQLGLDRELILALQSVGGAMGNMVCINNIVAVCSILGISGREGYVFLRTLGPLILYGLIAGIVAQFLQ